MFLKTACLLGLTVLPFGTPAAPAFDARGGQFIAFTRFSEFDRSRGQSPEDLVLTSPEILAKIGWDELIASWNTDAPSNTWLKVEAQAIYPDRRTKYYVLGLWSNNPDRFPRTSVPGQKDADGDVSTDTLALRQTCQRFQLRLTLGGRYMLKPKLKFVGLSLTDTHARPPRLPPNTAAWGQVIPVPERSQMSYPDGGVLCSPTTVSMLMAYWSAKLHRTELDQDVPIIAKAVYDTNWQGTGNWPFNTAYAGAYRGMRAYVTRMTDLAELEAWIAQGLPVGLSLCYDRLRGKGPGPNGHLVVCVGFTPQGDPILNDPGTSANVRKVFLRKNLINAWAYSHNAAYLVYPEDTEVPRDRFGHWHSWTSRQRISTE